MSDYLSNLVSQNLGLTETIAPQLPSLFASRANDSGWLTANYFPGLLGMKSEHEEVIDNETEFEETSSIRSPEMSRRAEHDIASDPILQQPEETNLRRVQNLDSPMIEAQQPTIAQPLPSPMPHIPEVVAKKNKRSLNQFARDLEPATPLQSPPALSELVVVPGVTKDSPKQYDNNPLILTHARAKIEIGTGSQPIEPKEQPAPLPVSIKQGRVAESLIPENEVMKSIVPSSEPGFNQQKIRPIEQSIVMLPFLSKDVMPPIRSNHLSAERTESAPTIRVNIGRIEVRAVMPSAPSTQPQRPKSAPMLTLDEYLKQRNGR